MEELHAAWHCGLSLHPSVGLAADNEAGVHSCCAGHSAGALPPSGGDIRVMGHSLLAPGGLEVAQSVMGVCPQFDVLWDELSGKEHMYIYGCIKGLPSAEVRMDAKKAALECVVQCRRATGLQQHSTVLLKRADTARMSQALQ